MAFELSRGGENIVAEVQRWQYFLRKRGIIQAGPIDGDFGAQTELATRIFQLQAGLPASGKADTETIGAARRAGFAVAPDAYYAERKSPDFPPKPAGLECPTLASRVRDLGEYRFIQLPPERRPMPEAIVVKGNGSKSVADWIASNIVTIEIPELRYAKGYHGSIRCHAKAARPIAAVFAAWERAGLMHLVMTYEGCFEPRYARGQAPTSFDVAEKSNADVPQLSDHAFGAAFDINVIDNQFKQIPAICGARGAVRELVKIANDLGIYWGGHYELIDGMRFEPTRDALEGGNA